MAVVLTELFCELWEFCHKVAILPKSGCCSDPELSEQSDCSCFLSQSYLKVAVVLTNKNVPLSIDSSLSQSYLKVAVVLTQIFSNDQQTLLSQSYLKVAVVLTVTVGNGGMYVNGRNPT